MDLIHSLFQCKQPSGYAGSNISFSFVAKQLPSWYNINMFRRIIDKNKMKGVAYHE